MIVSNAQEKTDFVNEGISTGTIITVDELKSQINAAVEKQTPLIKILSSLEHQLGSFDPEDVDLAISIYNDAWIARGRMMRSIVGPCDSLIVLGPSKPARITAQCPVCKHYMLPVCTNDLTCICESHNCKHNDWLYEVHCEYCGNEAKVY